MYRRAPVAALSNGGIRPLIGGGNHEARQHVRRDRRIRGRGGPLIVGGRGHSLDNIRQTHGERTPRVSLGLLKAE